MRLKTSRSLVVGLLSVVVLLGGRRALAQGGPIDVQNFRPAMDSKGLIGVESTQILSPGMFSIGLVVNYSHKPLVLKGAGDRVFQVTHLTTADIQFAIGLFRIKRVPMMELGFSVPITILTGRASPYITGDNDYPWNQATEASKKMAPLGYEYNGNFGAQGVGDIYLNLKSRLIPSTRARFGLGFILSVGFPASKIKNGDDHFLGSGGYTIWPRFVLDAFLDKARRVTFALNVGARLRFGTSVELTPNPG